MNGSTKVKIDKLIENLSQKVQRKICRLFTNLCNWKLRMTFTPEITNRIKTMQ